ncbi:gamma-glutamylcyclotransferase [Paraburkholderia sp. DHOC27]|uniref:gamma-glutamylcyclotransferase family protein n=1 Tax=Paraburkholderia sp. DHOC27 TaxID=2303330 RepID=UPI000E3D19B7|nr:gamma-glutamylcyclotransferase family protein [Paraburkholderia sp. DHOC27]RFU45526.1 gamma-glutamylcyclotransferase [Paraburkholderia sp. DHOC27]
MQKVFVYGTLRAGEINDIGEAAVRHGIGAPTLLGHTTVRGHLYDFGPYPGFVRDETGVPVHGDVYAIEAELIAVLDEIEEVYPGVEGLFIAEDVSLEVDGVATTCRFYPVSKQAVKGLPEIRSGDWVVYRRSREN